MFISITAFAQEIAPYIKVTESSESINQISEKVIDVLKNDNFTILGTYNPSNKKTLKVIAFTRNDLKNTVIKITDRGALAATFKIGLVEENGKTTVSYTNPDYILRAYLGDNYNTFVSTFKKFSADLKSSLSAVGDEFTPFGGTVEAKKLGKYHYKIMMPYFSDPVTLNEFSSFEEGLKTITGKTYVERVVMKAIKHDIAIYAIHTALDNALQGVNDMICEQLGLSNRKILIPQIGTIKKLTTYVPANEAEYGEPAMAT